MRVRTAYRAGGAEPGEDRVCTTDHAVVVLDGASAPADSFRSGGWLADVLGAELVDQLNADRAAPLQRILFRAIGAIAERYDLTPGEAPSTTVSIVRWDGDQVDALVLGDSPIVAMSQHGTYDVVRDDRLKCVATDERAEMLAGQGFGFDDGEAWQRLRDRERAWRNRDGGYWIAEALPDAAQHALVNNWRRADLAAVLAMTDGVAAGPLRYGVPPGWMETFAIARAAPYALLDAVHAAELGDAAGERWPRSKRHDDKAFALVDFTA